jgi:hypothetical protein
MTDFQFYAAVWFLLCCLASSFMDANLLRMAIGTVLFFVSPVAIVIVKTFNFVAGLFLSEKERGSAYKRGLESSQELVNRYSNAAEVNLNESQVQSLVDCYSECDGAYKHLLAMHLFHAREPDGPAQLQSLKEAEGRFDRSIQDFRTTWLGLVKSEQPESSMHSEETKRE